MSINIEYPNLKDPIFKNKLFENNMPINGLGNILYRLSFHYSLSKKYNLICNNYLFNEFLNYGISIKMFTNWKTTLVRNINFNNKKCNIDITLEEHKNHQIYDNTLIENISKYKEKNILIKNYCYLQSIKYFDEYKNEIQDLFSPDKESLNYIYLKYAQLKENINIGIHMRLKWGANLSYKIDYFKKAINLIEKKYNKSNLKINYFVCSDDITGAKNILSGLNYNFIYLKENLDYIDLWIMSLCNDNIICHSTFGWWGAYLNKNKNKTVIYPSDIFDFFYKKILRRQNIKEIKENAYPLEWICLKSSSMYKK